MELYRGNMLLRISGLFGEKVHDFDAVFAELERRGYNPGQLSGRQLFARFGEAYMHLRLEAICNDLYPQRCDFNPGIPVSIGGFKFTCLITIFFI